MAITDPNAFRAGAKFPPESENSRLARFNSFDALYRGSPASWVLLYPDRARNTNRLLGFSDYDELVQRLPRMHFNYFRKLSRYWASLLFSFPPTIEGSTVQSDTLRHIITAGYKVAVDSSRFGVGVYASVNNRIRAYDPRYWYPLTLDGNIDSAFGDIFAVPFTTDPTVINNRLQVTKLIPGEPITVEIFSLEGGSSIGARLETSTGETLAQRVVSHVVNGVNEDVSNVSTQLWAATGYGESDYPDLLHPVAEINRRMSGNSTVLDRFTNPHLAGPHSILSQDASGNPIFNIDGDFFPLSDDDVKPEYITWDANLEANFQQVDKAIELFHVLSDTSRAGFGIQGDGNSVESGAALRKLLYSSFVKLNMLRRNHQQALKDLLGADLNVIWPSPVLESQLELVQAEIEKLMAGLTTREQSISRIESVPASEAQRIAEEAMAQELPDTIRRRPADEPGPQE